VEAEAVLHRDLRHYRDPMKRGHHMPLMESHMAVEKRPRLDRKAMNHQFQSLPHYTALVYYMLDRKLLVAAVRHHRYYNS